jgi:hypothetical protein
MKNVAMKGPMNDLMISMSNFLITGVDAILLFA